MSDNEAVSQARVPDDVIAAFVFETALSIEGVRGMGLSKSAAALRNNILGRDKRTRGVRVLYDEDRGYTIEVFLIVSYGASIPETAWNVQKTVHDGLMSEFGFEPKDINIHVQGVYKEVAKAENEVS